ncbi:MULTISPECIES: M20 family metallopeptidase [Brevibacillus]|uniref:M20 family metallopeptidase n=1 Tax=Brevibacillus TaxID=55080 RepID=UPI002040A3FF|nr:MULTISPECIES: M20 family metallopeptidase [Brevibacillus]MCM3080739.1 M20 family metallopeptidase [Brevibacillus invocatus]MCM3430840.1 M20 family metallopeptidase [Brevibacillus invocatus]MDH4617775.1 M20 family metallopeptidase [Brevibacillus sp. AY1]
MKGTDLFAQVDQENAISFLQSLIQINSVNPPGAELAVAEAIQKRLVNSGLHMELDLVAENRANLLVSLNGDPTQNTSQDQGKTLVFSGHFDTVPVGGVDWTYPPFAGERVGDRIYGRGTTDMKSGVAAMIIAMECLAKSGITLPGNLLFAGTVGEEVDCLGAKEVARKGQIDHASAIVVSEPTANQVIVAHKGALWLEVTMLGKTAHGSMPDHGINAIQAIHRFITELNHYQLEHTPHEILGGSTLNIGMIRGGISVNVVPDQCSVTLDIRTVPGQNHAKILEEIQQLAQKASLSASCHIKVLNDMAYVDTSASNPFIRTAMQVAGMEQDASPRGVNYYTDASVYQPHLNGIPVLIYGPGEPSMAHQPDEWVDVTKYLDAIRYFIDLAVAYLNDENLA